MAGILKLIYLKDYRLLSVLEMDALISASLPGPRRLVTAVASGLDTPPLLLTPKKYDWCTRSAFALQALRIYELYRSEDLKSGISFSHYKNLRGGFFRSYTKTAITQG
jgi:hypothetical protein